MFKSIIAVAFIAALAACGGQANSATLDTSYTSTNDKVFSVERVSYIDVIGDDLVLTYDSGVSSVQGYYKNAGGAVTAKLLASGKFVKDPNAGRYIRVASAHHISCSTSTNGTTFYFLQSSSVSIIDSGCVIYNQIKANAN